MIGCLCLHCLGSGQIRVPALHRFEPCSYCSLRFLSTGIGENIPPVLRSLYDAVEGLPRLRDQLHSVERVNMPCMQGGLDLRDAAMQKIASAVAYLWHAAQNERDITPEIDLMAQAITVLQQQRPPRAGGQMQTLTLQIFEPSKPFGGLFVAENAPEAFVAAIQDLLTLTIQRGQSGGKRAAILEFIWNGEGAPGLLAGEMTDENAIFLLSDVLEETAGIWADIDAPIACYTSTGERNNHHIRRIGDLTVRQCLHAVEIH